MMNREDMAALVAEVGPTKAARMQKSVCILNAREALMRRWPAREVAFIGNMLTIRFDVGWVRLDYSKGTRLCPNGVWSASAGMGYGKDLPRVGQRDARGYCAAREDAVIAAELAIERMLIAIATGAREKLEDAMAGARAANAALDAARVAMDYVCTAAAPSQCCAP